MGLSDRAVAEVIRLTFEHCWEEFYIGQQIAPDVGGLPQRMVVQARSMREFQLDEMMDLEDSSDMEVFTQQQAGYAGSAFDGETDLTTESAASAGRIGKLASSARHIQSGARTKEAHSPNGPAPQVVWTYDVDRSVSRSSTKYTKLRHTSNALATSSRHLTAAASAPAINPLIPIRLPPPLDRPRSDPSLRRAPHHDPSLSPAPQLPTPSPRRGKPVKAVPEYTFCVAIEETFWIPEEDVMPFLPTMPEEAEDKFDYTKYGELLYQGQYAWEEKGRDPDLDIILTETMKRLTSAEHMRSSHQTSRALTLSEIDASGVLPQRVASIDAWQEIRDMPAFPRRSKGKADGRRKRVIEPSSSDAEEEVAIPGTRESFGLGRSFSQGGRPHKRRRRVVSSDEEDEEDREMQGSAVQQSGGGGLMPAFVQTSQSGKTPEERARAEVLDFDELNCPNAACRDFACALHVSDGTDHTLPAVPIPVPSPSARRILDLRVERCSIECFYPGSTRSEQMPPASLGTLSENDRVNLSFLLEAGGGETEPMTVCDLTLMVGSGADTAPASQGVDPGNLRDIPSCYQVGQYIKNLFSVATPGKSQAFTPSRPNLKQRRDGGLAGSSPNAVLPPPHRNTKATMMRFDLNATHMVPVELCHHEGPCDASNCRCFAAKIHCERDCTCGPGCKRRHAGCKCKSEPGNGRYKPCAVGNNSCPCRRDGRECDPGVCGPCGADHDHPDSKDRSIGKTSLRGLCNNVCIQSGHFQPVRVGVSPVAGYGLFADIAMKKGVMILEYVGEILNQNEGAKRGMIYEVTHRNYLFDLNKFMHIDAAHRGNEGRYINGGKRDEVNIICYVIHTQGNHRIGMFASRDIAAGEELLFDYGEHFNLASQNDPTLLREKRKAKAVKRKKKQDATPVVQRTISAGVQAASPTPDVIAGGRGRNKQYYHPKSLNGGGYFKGLRVV